MSCFHYRGQSNGRSSSSPKPDPYCCYCCVEVLKIIDNKIGKVREYKTSSAVVTQADKNKIRAKSETQRLTQVTVPFTELVLRPRRAAGIARHADVCRSIFVLILFTFQLPRNQTCVFVEQNYKTDQAENKHLIVFPFCQPSTKFPCLKIILIIRRIGVRSVHGRIFRCLRWVRNR